MTQTRGKFFGRWPVRLMPLPAARWRQWRADGYGVRKWRCSSARCDSSLLTARLEKLSTALSSCTPRWQGIPS